MKNRSIFRLIILSCALAMGAVSCVKVDYTMGYSVIPENEKFITRHFSVPIDSIMVSFIDSLSGYNSSRMTIGAIRDSKFGLTRRGAAFPLVPLEDTLNWGTNIRFRQFHFSALKDTCNFENDNQENILQNFRVYALDKALDSTVRYSCEIKKSMFEGHEIASKGVVIYCGSDSLSFNFSEKFARQYWEGMEGQTEIIDTVSNYTKKHPGIYICCDDPTGFGGRLNFFDSAIYLNSYSTLAGTYAELKFTADYTDSDGNVRKDVDTSFFFGYGATEASLEASFYSFNSCEHESLEKQWGTPVQIDCGEGYKKTVYLTNEEIPIEGGVGIKPLIQAKHLKRLVLQAMKDTLEKYGYDPTFSKKQQVFINKATVTLPYEIPADYLRMKVYPQILNPTLRISKVDTVTYAGLTDASVSDENQGEVDRSNCCYRPDISFHMQKILSTTSADTLRRENIWFLILANEVVSDSDDSSSSDASDYYSQMAYLSYYNSMLGGYYGGYSGYGYGSSSGSYYDNYYNYYMMQQMYSSLYSSSSDVTTSATLDRDRYYSGILRGSGADKNKGDVPHLDITYSFLLP